MFSLAMLPRSFPEVIKDYGPMRLPAATHHLKTYLTIHSKNVFISCQFMIRVGKWASIDIISSLSIQKSNWKCKTGNGTNLLNILIFRQFITSARGPSQRFDHRNFTKYFPLTFRANRKSTVGGKFKLT